jgi:3-oxoadipate enol-lactonase
LTDLHHKLDGPTEARVLVLSNSIGTDMSMWDGLMPELTDRFRVLRYDQRGHGGSPAPPGPYSIADLGGDVVTLLDRLGLERVSFCGVSLGGMTGMWLALNAPERVDRLGLLCTSPYLPPREGWLERAARVRADGMEPLVEASLERWFTPELAARSPGTVERARQALRAVRPEGYAGCCDAIAGHDVRAQLERIRAPTLVVATVDDPSTPPEHGREIAEGIDGAELVMFDHGRHLVVAEHPDEVGHELVRHLAGAGG